MNEIISIVNGIPIKHKLKPKKLDCKHLVVVFSGFGATGEFTYDMENVFQDLQAHVLWIKDDFHGHCSYYIAHQMEFKVRDAVLGLIENYLEEFNLTKDDCTLTGFSKGGSAALYFGLKFQFKNILTTVPQFNIGSYAYKNWKQTAENIFGEATPEKIKIIDSLIIDALEDDQNHAKNIYLLTSTADIQYPTEIQPNIHKLIKYDNFNLLTSKSKLVRAHNQVTGHHIPLILSIMHGLCSGATPRYGYTELWGDQKTVPQSKEPEAISILKTSRIQDDRIFLEGVGILKTIPCENYSDIQFKLNLTNKSQKITFDAAKDHRASLSRTYYENGFVCYDKGWFTSWKNAGFDFSEVPDGNYEVSLTIHCGGHIKTTSMTSEKKISIEGKIIKSSISIKTNDDMKIIFSKKS